MRSCPSHSFHLRIIVREQARQRILGRGYNITPYYKRLHFLPIEQRIKFKACLFGYKIFYRLMPSYILDNFSRFTPNLAMELREGAGRDTKMFASTTADHKRNDLFQRIKNEWNALPMQIRECASLPIFKKKLKTFLF